jgi:hypothetical protein
MFIETGAQLMAIVTHVPTAAAPGINRTYLHRLVRSLQLE